MGIVQGYCKQDVVTERAILKRLNYFPVPEEEQELWQQDIRMNAFGVRVDSKLIEGALTIDGVSSAELTEEAINITGLQNPNSTAQLKVWVKNELSDSLEMDVELRDCGKRRIHAFGKNDFQRN